MSLLNSLIPIATDSEGRTYPDAYLYSYAVGTYTPKDTYSNVGLSTPNANPLQADGAGRFFNLYLGSGGYRLVLRDKYGVQIWDQDNYYQAADGSDVAALETDIADAKQILATTFYGGSDSGAADAYVLTAVGLQVEPTTYQEGMIIAFIPQNPNTGASTVTVGGLSAKNLLDSSGNPLAAGFLQATSLYQFVYTFGQFYFFFKSGLVTTDIIEDGAVTSDKIATNAVITAKILDSNVTLPKLADGDGYKLIGYDNAGAPTQHTNPMRLLTSGSFTAAASVPFVLSTLDATQSVDNSYLLRIIGAQPATDGDEIYLTLSSDAGSTYVATNYDFVSRGLASDTATARNNQAAAAAQWIVATGGGGASNYDPSNAAGETISMDIYITNINTGTSIRPFYTGTGSYWTVNASLISVSIGGSQSVAADYDAIKLTCSSGGNFAAVGKYYLYKLANST
jgi:hypothetical protein